MAKTCTVNGYRTSDAKQLAVELVIDSFNDLSLIQRNDVSADIVILTSKGATQLRDFLNENYPVTTEPVPKIVGIDVLEASLIHNVGMDSNQEIRIHNIKMIIQSFKVANGIPLPIELKWQDIGDVSVCLWKDVTGVEQTATVVKCQNREAFTYKPASSLAYLASHPLNRDEAKRECEAKIRESLAL